MASVKTFGSDRNAVVSNTRTHCPWSRRAAKALAVFADRVPTERGDWQLVSDRSSFGALLEGSGWLLVDRLADSLGVTLVDELS